MGLPTDIEPDLLRKKTVEIVKHHKASWIELGQYLYTVYKDKHFRTWGYYNFDAYCLKELRLKSQTASKLLKSYYYLEKQEPALVEQSKADPSSEESRPAPNYESVNVLRLAQANKSIGKEDLDELRHAALEEGKEPQELRKRVQQIVTNQKEATDAEGFRRNQRNTKIRRVISVLSSTRRDLEGEELLPKYLLNQMDELRAKLEDQIEE